jgi:hypothetical protein
MTTSRAPESPSTARSCVYAVACFLAASVVALDRTALSIALGVVPFDDTSHPIAAAALASVAGLFGALAVTANDVGTHAGGEP